MKAFVLINAELGNEDAIAMSLSEISQVKKVYLLYGVYDMLVEVDAGTADELNEVITWKIRRLKDVRSTLTMRVVR